MFLKNCACIYFNKKIFWLLKHVSEFKLYCALQYYKIQNCMWLQMNLNSCHTSFNRNHIVCFILSYTLARRFSSALNLVLQNMSQPTTTNLTCLDLYFVYPFHKWWCNLFPKIKHGKTCTAEFICQAKQQMCFFVCLFGWSLSFLPFFSLIVLEGLEPYTPLPCSTCLRAQLPCIQKQKSDCGNDYKTNVTIVWPQQNSLWELRRIWVCSTWFNYTINFCERKWVSL